MTTDTERNDTTMAQEPQQHQETRLTELPPVTSGNAAVDGRYVLELRDLFDAGQSQFPDDNGNYKQRVRLAWEVYDVLDSDAEDYDALVGQVWSQYTNYTMAARSNLYGIACAILKTELPVGAMPKVDELIGGRVKMTIATSQGRNGKPERSWTAGPYQAGRRPTRRDDEPEREPASASNNQPKTYPGETHHSASPQTGERAAFQLPAFTGFIDQDTAGAKAAFAACTTIANVMDTWGWMRQAGLQDDAELTALYKATYKKIREQDDANVRG